MIERIVSSGSSSLVPPLQTLPAQPIGKVYNPFAVSLVESHLATMTSKEMHWSTVARFTKYLMTILRLSYDNAKVTIDLRRTSNLQNILRGREAFLRYDSLAKL